MQSVTSLSAAFVDMFVGTTAVTKITLAQPRSGLCYVAQCAQPIAYIYIHTYNDISSQLHEEVRNPEAIEQVTGTELIFAMVLFEVKHLIYVYIHVYTLYISAYRFMKRSGIQRP